MLAALEGLFVEPASAASVAGLRRALAQGMISLETEVVVAVLTGHGLKDPEIAMRTLSPPIPVQAQWDAFRRVLEPIIEESVLITSPQEVRG